MFFKIDKTNRNENKSIGRGENIPKRERCPVELVVQDPLLSDVRFTAHSGPGLARLDHSARLGVLARRAKHVQHLSASLVQPAGPLH